MQDIIFQCRGGELLYWIKSKDRRKKDIKPNVSIFVSQSYDSKRGGMIWELLTNGKPHTVSVENIILWDCQASYLNEKGELID